MKKKRLKLELDFPDYNFSNDARSGIEQNLCQIESKMDSTYFEISNIKNLIQCQNVHRDSFLNYKNQFKGKTVVLVGAGPSAKYHKKIEGAVYVGVNNACLLEQIKLDFLFCQDFYMDQEKCNAIIDYKKGECTKFFGIIPDKRIESCRRTEVAKHVRRGRKQYFLEADASPYYIYDMYKNETALNIENEPLKADGVIFCALQFVLYGHPEKIYIVGCDCTSGFFYDSEKVFDNTYMIKMWEEFRDYIEEFYPDITVISINPVGLKGMFQDEFT